MSSKLDEVTALPFGEIILVMIRESGKHGNIPGQPVPLPKFYSALRARIQRTSDELLSGSWSSQAPPSECGDHGNNGDRHQRPAKRLPDDGVVGGRQLYLLSLILFLCLILVHGFLTGSRMARGGSWRRRHRSQISIVSLQVIHDHWVGRVVGSRIGPPVSGNGSVSRVVVGFIAIVQALVQLGTLRVA